MQIDRQPSPWPCLAILAGLLLFCLMAPRYWRHAVTAEDATIGVSAESVENGSRPSQTAAADFDDSAKSNFAAWPLNFPEPQTYQFDAASPSNPLNQRGASTIEDLIATRLTLSQLAEHAGRLAGESFDWPVMLRAAKNAELARSNDGPALASPRPPNPELTAAMEFIGEKLGEQLSADGTDWLVMQIAEGVPRCVVACGEKCESLLAVLPAVEVTSPSEQRHRSTVRLVGPNDRLAMLPAPRELDGALRPWCVPQVLFDQLDRLADQADSAQWASHVRNQLHALTDREQLQGDDVQTILGNLTDAAQEAWHMADQTNDDRLRVELLRAHWALARRLDCWAQCTSSAWRCTFRVVWPLGVLWRRISPGHLPNRSPRGTSPR